MTNATLHNQDEIDRKDVRVGGYGVGAQGRGRDPGGDPHRFLSAVPRGRSRSVSPATARYAARRRYGRKGRSRCAAPAGWSAPAPAQAGHPPFCEQARAGRRGAGPEARRSARRAWNGVHGRRRLRPRRRRARRARPHGGEIGAQPGRGHRARASHHPRPVFFMRWASATWARRRHRPSPPTSAAWRRYAKRTPMHSPRCPTWGPGGSRECAPVSSTIRATGEIVDALARELSWEETEPVRAEAESEIGAVASSQAASSPPPSPARPSCSPAPSIPCPRDDAKRRLQALAREDHRKRLEAHRLRRGRGEPRLEARQGAELGCTGNRRGGIRRVARGLRGGLRRPAALGGDRDATPRAVYSLNRP